MRKLRLAIATSLLCWCSVVLGEEFPGKAWPKPQDRPAHWSGVKLAAAKRYSDEIHSAAVMIVRHGAVVAQWGDTSRRISSYSVRKSFLSALYGISVAEGRIDIGASLAALGVDDSPDPLTPVERQARVVDLLRARSGVYHPVDFETQAMIDSRPARDSHPPGSFWFYNNWDFNALGTIYEKLAGAPIGEAFYRRIAVPIGMQDYRASDVYYLEGPLSVHRAIHFEVSARDMARFGLLYLHGGRWKGRKIVPAEWVARSAHATEMIQFGGEEAGGYENLWWVAYQGKNVPGALVPDGTFSAQGAGGHFIVVVPKLDLVIVHRGDNQPASHDVATVTQGAYKGNTRKQVGHLLQLILDAAE